MKNRKNLFISMMLVFMFVFAMSVNTYAESPISIYYGVTDVYRGLQSTETKDLIIKENVSGAFVRNDTIQLEIDTENFAEGKGILFRDANIEVVKGDLELKNIEIDGNIISFRIKSESSENNESIIKISGVSVSTNRDLPITNEKPLNINLYTNWGYGKIEIPYINII